MVNSAPRPDASLPELLAARAHGASDARLALDVALGLLAAAAAGLWRPTGWIVMLSAALCFAAFGAWGIAERELGERVDDGDAPQRRLLRVQRSIAVAVGGAAFVVLVLGALAFAFGTVIS
jgi:hypothetical protein